MSTEMLMWLLFLFLFGVTVALAIKADRLSKRLLVVSNIGLAFVALLPTTLVRLDIISNEGNIGILAVTYFVFSSWALFWLTGGASRSELGLRGCSFFLIFDFACF